MSYARFPARLSTRFSLPPAISLIAALLILAAPPAHTDEEILWWHAMGGELGQKVDALAAGFNASQDTYTVRPVYKGNYSEVLNAAIAAFRAGTQPHIVQVFEVGTATMMTAQNAIYPVYQLMADVGEPFDPDAYLPAVASYYTTTDGRLLSLPFNSSTPVFYYNKDAFAKAGLDPERPPKTWPEMGQAMAAVRDAGYECGFSTAWQSWIQIENFSAWHNLPIGTQENGFGGLATELVINSPAHVNHLKTLAEWSQDGRFRYGGRRGDGQGLFTSGACVGWFHSSAGYASIRDTAEFDFGIAPLPYWPELIDEPQNSIIGGATLWVLRGHEAYDGVARFFSYLSSRDVQADWHQFTGYLPITLDAWKATEQSGFYRQNPGTDVAISQVTGNSPTANSKGLRFGSFVQIRDIINEEMEALWAGKKTAQQALDDATRRGNELLRRFERDHS